MKLKRLKTYAAAGMICILAIGSSMTAFAQNREDYRRVFPAEYYYNQYPDLQTAIGMDEERLFEHFVTFGVKEGRKGCEDFNLRAYVRHNNDLFLAFGKDYSRYCRHYEEFGKSEGRISQEQESDDRYIGSVTTYYKEAQQRTTNVKLAASRVNGKVLQPGELMSFSDTILPRTIANGYVAGPAIKRTEIGGGICQVSSTLYAAMCQAMMPAVERHPHSEPITYLPKGLDATISEGYLDLKLVNIYSDPLMIHASAENGALTVTLELLKSEPQDVQTQPETTAAVGVVTAEKQ